MNRQCIFWVLTILLTCLGSCTDETKELIGVDIVETYEVDFEITDETLTSTTYSFAVTPSDQKAPYVCLYVDKSVIDKVPKYDLPAFLLKELKKKAEVDNKSWQEYLASISLTGNIKKTIDNLLPGNMYELVVFGLKGEQISRQATYRFFETLKADNVQMSFDVDATIEAEKPTTVKLRVKPSLTDYKWYFCSFPKTSYDRAKEAGMSDIQICSSVLREELQRSIPPTATQADIDKFVQSKFYENEREMTISGRAIKADTEYAYLLTAVYLTPGNEVVFTSEVTMGTFKTFPVAQKDTEFTLDVSNIRQTRVAISITPSNASQAYVWRCDAYNDMTSKMTPEEHAKHIIDTNPYISFEARPYGNVSNDNYKIIPGTKHYLIAFGYEGGVCTKVVRQDIEPVAAGDPLATTFVVEQLERTTDRVKLKVTPSDTSVYYLPFLFPDTESKERLKGKFIASLRRTLDQNISSGFNPYATIWNMIAQQTSIGTSTPEYVNVTPGGQHTLMIVTFDKNGIAGERLLTPSYLTVPGFSQETVGNVEVLGIFDGNEENGAIFKQPWLVKDKAIMVLKYALSSGVSEAFAATSLDVEEINEMDTTLIPDNQLVHNGNLRWTSLKLTKPYMYVVVEWGKPQVSFSYGLSTAKERGPIARTALSAADRANKKSIDELQRLYDEPEATPARALRLFDPFEGLRSVTRPTSSEEIGTYLPVTSKEEQSISPQQPKRKQTAQNAEGHKGTEIDIPLVYVVR